MKINPDKCVACGNCTYVCPMGAIYVDPVMKRATIDRDECVECYACYNGLSTEHLNPPMVRLIGKIFKMGVLLLVRNRASAPPPHSNLRIFSGRESSAVLSPIPVPPTNLLESKGVAPKRSRPM